MSREIRRVPRGFDWPHNKTWAGYLRPEWLHEAKCATCDGTGYSAFARRIRDQWYGYTEFHPASTGCELLTADTPRVRAFAERNVTGSPGFYGRGKAAIRREAQRLADLWNGQMCHHLRQDDVDALVEAGRLMDFTHTWTKGEGWAKKEPPYRPSAAEVNEWSLDGFGHDALNLGIVVEHRCAKVGRSERCDACNGEGHIEKWVGQRALAEAWEPIEPPTGEAWQVWETVSEGSPISPAFDAREELVEFLTTPAYRGIGGPLTREQAEAFVEAGSSLGTFVVSDGQMTPGDAVAGGLS